ncbi:Glycosyltransferase 8 domain-containing protein 1 [Symbiodinium microadriaticum]|uniref:Glycosyltransferase 8 domain-containing protein 1 n=1 Tax=Symbiodinium microadriaticum TaxID=2951 RepID=A0A1Q9D498_SYMMI|nr:Glycosyltransferase 8 domain-containing protein 1 [Symbiodinium microadriaticum]
MHGYKVYLCFRVLLTWCLVVAVAHQVVEKHASELDLNCESYEDGIDWPQVRENLFVFLRRPSGDHPFLDSLFAIGRRKSDCYIGLCCLGYLAIVFMSPEKRLKAMSTTLFGSVPLWDQIPLSYWDTINSKWPIFGLLEVLQSQMRDPSSPAPAHADGCCDRMEELDQRFHKVLDRQLAAGQFIPAQSSLRYLAESPSRCSFGKAAAYVALGERLLLVGSPVLTQAAKDLLALGEAQLDRCAVGRNATVFEQMQSAWPTWYSSPPLRPATSLPRPDRAPPQRLPPDPGAVGTATTEARGVHVALSGDDRHMEGLLAALQSLVLGVSDARRVCVHVFALQQELSGLKAALGCSFKDRLAEDEADPDGLFVGGVAVRIHIFTESEVLSDEMAVDAGVTVEAGDLNAPHNFVRFHLGKWIPYAQRIVYLDTDVIVKGDVCELHDSVFHHSHTVSGKVLAAVPRRHLPLSFYLKVFSPRMPIWVPSSAPSFNAGVMVIDMLAWAEHNVTGEVLAWARRNKNRDLWRHGSQPPLLLLLYDRVEWIADIWNVDGLGHYGNRSSELISKAKILHWTGPLKPWLGSLD